MPNGNYAQPATANPIASALKADPASTASQNSPDNTGTAVTRDGKPNLSLMAPQPLHGRYDNGDSDVSDAQTILGNASQNYLGRPWSSNDIQTALRNQGLKPNDQYVGAGGLNFIIQQLFQSPEAQNYRASLAPPATDPTVDRSGGQTAPLTNALTLPTMQMLEAGGSMTPDTTQALLAQAKQSLALQRSLSQ